MMLSRASAEALTSSDTRAVRGEVGVEGEFRHADDAVHGSANLVAHVGQKFTFGPRRGLRSLTSCGLGSIQGCVADSHRRLRHETVQEGLLVRANWNGCRPIMTRTPSNTSWWRMGATSRLL